MVREENTRRGDDKMLQFSPWYIVVCIPSAEAAVTISIGGRRMSREMVA